tara:strand:+ start:72465 stop:73136 length:672 start_codon:yes stop_codon:yes gene_type:complete
MAKIYKDGKFFKYYKESWFNPIGMTDDGYYIHVPSEDICDEYKIVKEHGRLKAFHPSSKWARHPGEIEPAGLFVTKNFTGRWYYIDTEITDKERANKENWMSENIRRREEAKLRKEENIKKWKAKSSFQGEVGDSLELELSIMFQSSFPTNWGTGHITTLKDENANVYVIWREFWDNETDEPMTKGTKVKGTFKVKGHNERNDQKQTVLQNKIDNLEFSDAES